MLATWLPGAYCDALRTTEGASHYLAASNMRHLFPELRDDFEEPRWLAANGRVHSGPFLWIASAGHYEFTHLDPDCGFLAVISGRKRVRLWPSHLVHELYPNPLGADGRTIQSAVDLTLDAAALRARFPAFVPEAGTEVTLEAGDLLYIPAFTWHQVSSLEQSISINFFWGEQARARARAACGVCIRRCACTRACISTSHSSEASGGGTA